MSPFGNEYLRNPGQLHALHDGEAWGPHVIAVDFIGGPYLIRGLNDLQRKLLQEHFSEAVRSSDRIDGEATVIQVYKAQVEDFLEISTFPCAVNFDFTYQQDYIDIAGYRSMARVSLEPRVHGMLWTSEQDEREFPCNIVENIFRVLVSYHLIKTGGMLIHSAGIVDDGLAYIFPGRSGDGKSTLSRLSLSEGREVLSDDMNALIWRNNTPMLEKVPFSGDLGRTWTRSSSFRLAGIFRLHKQNNVAVAPMVPAESLSLLISSVPFLNNDPYRLPLIMESLHKLVSLTKSHTIGFSVNKPLWPEITKYLARERAEQA